MLQQKLSGLATGATIAVMFSVVGWLAPLLQDRSAEIHVVAVAIGAVTSVGVYKSLAAFLVWAFSKSLLLRKLLLGDSFLEGTWVGHIKRGNVDYLTLEFFDQSQADRTQIQGRSLFASGDAIAHWRSDAVAINREGKQLTYAYTCAALDKTSTHEGLGVFQLRKDGSSGYVSVLDGYATDVIDGKRDANREFKISDKVMSDDIALDIAKRRFGLA